MQTFFAGHTTNAARWLSVESELGSVEVGKTANLLILAKNPLQDIANSKSIEQVILNGTVHQQADLAQAAKLPKK